MRLRLGERNTGSLSRTNAARPVWVVLHLNARKRGSMEEQLLALGERLRRRRRAAALKRWCDRRAAVSRGVAQSLGDVEWVADGSLEIIENGIRLDRFTGVTGADAQAAREELGVAEQPLILCVARLASEKGV